MLIEIILIGVASAVIGSTRSPPKARAAKVSVSAANQRSGRPKSTLAFLTQAPTPAIIRVNRNIALMGASLGMILGGMIFYTPLFIAGVTLNLLAAGPMLIRDLYLAVVKERRVGMAFLEVIFAGLLIATGQFVAVALCSLGFLIGRKLVLHTEAHSQIELSAAFALQTTSVWIKQGDQEIEAPLESLTAGDVIVVGAGDVIPVDGVVVAGTALIDQRILTGEGAPAEKTQGDAVLAPTVALSGRLEIRVDKTGPETAAAEMRRLLLNASEVKSDLHSRGEAIADASALPTLAAGGAALLMGMSGAQAAALINANFGRNLTALGPIAMLRHMAYASREGVLIKDGRALEALADIDAVLFDKTGTLTQDTPTLNRIHCFGQWGEQTLLSFGAAVQGTQKHPIALALKSAASARGLQLPKVDEATYEVGRGFDAQVDGYRVSIGGTRMMAEAGIDLAAADTALQFAHLEGATVVWIAIEDRLAGAFDLRATLRPEARSVIDSLRAREMKRIEIISGDAPAPTQALAEILGVDAWHAEITPDGKAALVKRLQTQGLRVCFVGDGINDAIAMRQADVSISLSEAAVIASDAAQIVLIENGLDKLPVTFDLANSLAKRLNSGVYASIIPGLLAMGGVLFLHIGVMSTILINQTGLFAGLAKTSGKPAVDQRLNPRPDGPTT